jgi:hypothetical protein
MQRDLHDLFYGPEEDLFDAAEKISQNDSRSDMKKFTPFASTVLPRAVETQTPPRRAARKGLITRSNLVAGTRVGHCLFQCRAA